MDRTQGVTCPQQAKPSRDICNDPRPRLDFGPPLAYFGAIMAAKSDPNSKLIAENRRARFDYAIESDIEAGIILQGSEVKSLRQGGANIAESYASVEGGELYDSIDDQPKISADGSQELGGLGKRSADIPVEKLEKINQAMQSNS